MALLITSSLLFPSTSSHSSGEWQGLIVKQGFTDNAGCKEAKSFQQPPPFLYFAFRCCCRYTHTPRVCTCTPDHRLSSRRWWWRRRQPHCRHDHRRSCCAFFIIIVISCRAVIPLAFEGEISILTRCKPFLHFFSHSLPLPLIAGIITMRANCKLSLTTVQENGLQQQVHEEGGRDGKVDDEMQRGTMNSEKKELNQGERKNE